MSAFELPAPAKLNLFLHVTGRRSDGYHELQTVFQLLDFGDTLRFEPPDGDYSDDIEIRMSGAEIPASENIVLAAAKQVSAGRSIQPVVITVHKNVPLGGGLGGGSSDAATTLHGLNRFWNLGLSVQELLEVGGQLGADVPVFVAGESCWAEGIGDELTPLSLPDAWYLVLVPDCHVSTAEVFGHPDLTRHTSAITIARFLNRAPVRNDCENVVRVRFPKVAEALDWLSQWGTARMTGTGACVFLSSPDPEYVRAILKEAKPEWRPFVARGVQQSPLIRTLGQTERRH